MKRLNSRIQYSQQIKQLLKHNLHLCKEHMQRPTTISLNCYYYKKSMVFKQNPLLGHQFCIRSLKKKSLKKDVNNIS